MQPVKTYVPRDIGEVLDQLNHMLLRAPKFVDKTGYFPFENLDYAFRQLAEGLSNIRRTIGEERYHKLMGMSDQMRALFEADPENTTGETRKGRDMIYEMEGILKQVRRKS